MSVYILPSGTHREDVLLLAASSKVRFVSKLIMFPLACGTEKCIMEAKVEGGWVEAGWLDGWLFGWVW